MPTRTPNHGYRLFAQGEMPWDHREEFQQLDIEAPIVRPDAEKSTFEPRANALYVAHEGPVYRGDGASWIQIGDLTSSGGGGGDPTLTDGIENKRDHVGPIYHGDYHENPDLWGIHFAAQANLRIESVVLDYDAASSTSDQATIELWEATTDSSPGHPNSVAPTGVSAPVASVTTTLTDGPQRVSLGFSTPATPTTGEFFIGVDAAGAHLRRVANWGEWAEYTTPRIDLQYGGRFNNPTTGDFSTNYYRMFDLEIGDPTTRVTSPWSHDVEEIYMRPRPPEEEFDNVSPRSIWFDTSG